MIKNYSSFIWFHPTTVSILLVRKANAKGSVSGFEIAPLSKGGGSDEQLAVD